MGSLSLKDGVWEVAADPHVTMVMKRMFPRLKPHERGTMRLKHSETVARDLVWFLTRHALNYFCTPGPVAPCTGWRVHAHPSAPSPATPIPAPARHLGSRRARTPMRRR